MAGYLDHYLRRFDVLLSDPRTIEVAINSDAKIWIEQTGAAYMTPFDHISLKPSDVTDLAQQIANRAELKLTASDPLVSTTVGYCGATIRAQAIVSPAASGGTVLAFRLFRQREKSEEPRQFRFLRNQLVSVDEERIKRIRAIRDLGVSAFERGDADGFLRACIREKLNMVISGGTSTGKTELARRMLWMVEAHERLVLIEDSAELLPQQPNVVSLIASRSEKSQRSADKLLQATLRLRPDRIILGELRGSEALTFLEAINTGHAGSFTTLHADTARKAMDRLSLMVLNTGTQLNYGEILRYLRGSIDVVIQTGRENDDRGILETYFPVLDENLV